MRVKRKMYSVNGIKAMRSRVVKESDEGRVELDVEDDDSARQSSLGQVELTPTS
jgi:hypothetical protein